MDAQRFDAITKAWAGGGASRRQVLRRLAGGLAGTMITAVGAGIVGRPRTSAPRSAISYSTRDPPRRRAGRYVEGAQAVSLGSAWRPPMASRPASVVAQAAKHAAAGSAAPHSGAAL
jgi:hypothetical protein